MFASKSQAISSPPPSGSKESLASSLASWPVFTKSGRFRTISGIALTKMLRLAESDAPLSLNTSTDTSKIPALSKTWLMTPCLVVFVSPSPKTHLYSSIIVGSGVVEARASKFTVSPELIVSLSELRLAFGLPGPIPPQPARDWEISRTIKSVVTLCPPSFMFLER